MALIDDMDRVLRGQWPEVFLSASTLGGAADLADAFTRYFYSPVEDAGAGIAITAASDYRVDPVAETISFKGWGKGGPFDGMELSAVSVRLSSGSPHVTIHGERQTGWSLQGAFPDVDAPLLRQLRFAAARLTFASHDEGDDVRGFSFSGALDFASPPLDALAFLLNHTAPPQLSGAIDMRGSATETVTQFVPDLMLSVDESAEAVALGPFRLEGPRLAILSNSRFNAFDRRWQNDSFIRVRLRVGIETDRPAVVYAAEPGDSGGLSSDDDQKQTLWLMLSATIVDIARDITFEAEIGEPIGAALAELAGFVKVDLSIPSFPLKNTADLTLKALQIRLDPTAAGAAGKVKRVRLAVGTAPGETWALWDRVVLDNIDLDFRLSPADASLQVTVSGRVAESLDLWAEFSTDETFAFYGSLAKSTPIKDIYGLFSDPAGVPLPDLSVEEANFRLDLDVKQKTNSGFAGGFAVEGAWVLLEAPKIALNGLNFNVNREPGGETKFELGCVFAITDYSMGLTGTYDTLEGWTLAGDLALAGPAESGAGSPMDPLESMVARIDDELGIDASRFPSIPHFLRAWYACALHVEFASKKSLNFRIAIGNDDMPGLEVDFAVDLSLGGSAYQRQFAAVARYRATKVDVTFNFSFSEQKSADPTPSKTITAKGAYAAVGADAPKLSDVLAAIVGAQKLDQNLPAELNMDAELTGFDIEIKQTDAAPAQIEAGGAFSIQVAGQAIDFDFGFTNACSFDAAGAQPALVDGARARVFGVAIGGLLDLSKLPVVGKIPGVDRLRIDRLGFYYTNAQFDGAGRQLYFAIPSLDPQGALGAAPTPASLSSGGFSLVAVLGSSTSGGAAPPPPLGAMPSKVNTGQPAAGVPPGFAAGAAAPESPVKWLDVNKTFGPFTLQKVGLGYASGEASIGFCAGLAMGGFSLALQGLTVTFPMPLPGKPAGASVGFDLQGLMFDVKRDAFTMGGAFLEVIEGGLRSYYGEVIVHAANFGLTAIGGYTPATPAMPAAFFIYVKLDAPLGGPPFLFVTGLAGGFGVNRALVLPTLQTLATYPLLPNNAPPQGASAGDTLTNALKALQGVCPDRPGAYWVAVGVKFTSFEMIEAFALLTVSFGVDLQIALLGECSMSFPKGEPQPVAYAEIDIVASVTPSTGLFTVFGVVSPASFVYGGFCHLFGGFAFSLWFGGEHRGDFVVTLGGYHPAYLKPAHYPAPPRLGLSFALGGLQVEGRAYFALTPAMMMGGLAVTASFAAEGVKAWLAFDVDFLIAWAPFHYGAVAHLNIGCKLDIGLITLDVHIGADMTLWGPAFGGIVHVDLDVVVFDIAFGAAPVAPAPLDWAAFKAKFLPKDSPASRRSRGARGLRSGDAPTTNLVMANVAAGLLASDVDDCAWVLDPDGFVIATSSVIPCTAAAWSLDAANDFPIPSTISSYDPARDPAAVLHLELAPGAGTYSDQEVWNPALHVGPMDRTDVVSRHAMRLLRLDESKGVFDIYVTGVTLRPELAPSNSALWGRNSPNRGANDAGLLPAGLTGFRISPGPSEPARLSGVALDALIFEQGNRRQIAEPPPVADDRYRVTSSRDPTGLGIAIRGAHSADFRQTGMVLGALADDWIGDRRAQTLRGLRDCGLALRSAEEIDVSRMARYTSLEDWPAIARLLDDGAAVSGRAAGGGVS